MGKIQKFEDLEVWKKAMDIGSKLYLLTKQPKMLKEFSINDQLVRASLSISNNIAEGFEYDNRKDFIKFLRYSKGSTGEVRNILNFLLNVKLINKECFDDYSEELKILSRQLYTLIKYLRNYDSPSSK